MLKIDHIKKIYSENTDNPIMALKDISIHFRECEFASILGPSGCGKTTLLNIIGGLDRYTSGDLIINNVSTKQYSDRDWDTYRNHKIGFVFQSYNLIPHLTILENVELALTIGGISYNERKEAAKKALISVGLEDKLNKKPNQLSGGQMQRVSIARALVNEPDIILADEPTGALDSDTSVTVMNLLKEISKTRLVIMVTHNAEIANKYSTRIVKMLDGNIIGDTNPYNGEEIVKTIDKKNSLVYTKKHSSMNFRTAFKLSGKNLLSKKKRTFITSLAASIGIIGIAIILSLSTGMQNYIDNTMLDSASFNYISISSNSTTFDMSGFADINSLEEFPSGTTGIIPYEQKQISSKKQNLSDELISYIESETKDLVIDITYSYSVGMNVLTKNDDTYTKVNSSNWHEQMNNIEYIKNRYDVLASLDNKYIPSDALEVSVVVDKYNRLSTTTLKSLGIKYSEDLSIIDYNDILGKEYRIVFNDAWYNETVAGETTIYRAPIATDYPKIYDDENGVTVKVVSVLRQAETSQVMWYQDGILYSPALTKLILEKNKNSKVGVAQAASETIDVTTGNPFASGGFFGGTSYESNLQKFGYISTPSQITIYPTNVDNRKEIINILDKWNEDKKDTEAEIEYIDMSTVMTSMLNSVVNVITYVLMAFSITSLVISSIMIAIIIYASVIERIKEIGVLRSLGARKKDVGRIFEAEAVLIGLISGIIAILITIGLDAIINIILENLLNVSNIASLTPLIAISLILLSAFLLLIASLVPASIASKKEPAVALRTE